MGLKLPSHWWTVVRGCPEARDDEGVLTRTIKITKEKYCGLPSSNAYRHSHRVPFSRIVSSPGREFSARDIYPPSTAMPVKATPTVPHLDGEELFPQ